MNWTLAAATLTAVIGFGSSDALAGAFGIAVSLLMAITTLMATFVALQWKFNLGAGLLVNGSLLALDLLFFASTSTKLLDGGWFPLLIAFVISFIMLTWRKGEEIMDAVRAWSSGERAPDFLDDLKADPPYAHSGNRRRAGAHGARACRWRSRRISSTTGFCTRMCCWSRWRWRKSRAVPEDERVSSRAIGEGLTRVELRYGFMEQPDVPEGLADAWRAGGSKFDPGQVIYFTGHETIIPLGRRSGMARWREAIFAFMHHNSQRPGAYFKIPSARSWRSASSSRSEGRALSKATAARAISAPARAHPRPRHRRSPAQPQCRHLSRTNSP